MDSSERKRKIGATKHCAYGTCNSDSRYPERAEMRDVFFIRFPKPGKDFEKCQRWVKACCRVGFDETWVKKDTYICSLHFVGGNGPTDLHPDPIPANATKYDVQRIKKTPRRRIQRRLILKESPNTVLKQTRSDNNQASQQPFNTPHGQETDDHDIATILLSLSEKVDNKENIPDEENEQPYNNRYMTEARVSSEIFTARKLCTKSSQTEAGSSQEIALRIKNKILENENENLKSKLEISQTLTKETNVKRTVQVRCDFDFSELENDDKKAGFSQD
ncbi:uncharacterized protein LOC123526320 [Mercenaria mercenaria]|uniref:uncharacterized protein LOC123526320 n=1 Tax=Mercenaria mercenaria TaxID=6596 RepID=UPI00234F7ED0|nr:uncharacterized protein LOC123526320 [Mercenaria mercenaria]